MRILCGVVLTLTLAGCSAPQHNQTVQTNVQPSPQVVKMKMLPTASHSIQIYNNVEELKGKQFLALGAVSGDDCQVRMQDLPPDLIKVREKMQSSALELSGNSLLMQRCEIRSDVQGCYRQANCQGTAIRVVE